MFYRLIRLIFSMLLALVAIATSVAVAFPVEQPTQPIAAAAPILRGARANVTRINAAPIPARLFAAQRPPVSARRPDTRLLAAGAPETIILQVVPNSLIVNSGATAIITATVYDISREVVGGVDLTGIILPSSLFGTVGVFSQTNASGQATSTWTAGNTVGTGTIQVFTGTVSGSFPITLTADAPYTVTLTANPISLTVGATSALTATVVDQYGNPVENGTPVTFTSDIGIPVSPGTTTAGIATSSINTTLAGTAHITATAAGGASGFTSVVFNPGAPAIMSISPATAVITAGVRIAYTTIATDTYGNSIGNVTAGTSFTISPGSGRTFVGNAITPTIKGTYTVTGTNGAVATASLVVTPSTFSRLSIENGLGAPINAYNMSVYDTLTAYAVGYDVYSNTIGSQTANWGGTGVVAGNVNPIGGTSTTFTAVVSGTGTITAASAGIPAATGLITVQAPVLQISKSDNIDPVTPGAQLRYTIRYTNTSTFAAQSVMITETYPLSTTYDHASPSPTTSPNVWSIPSLAAGASSTIDVYVNVASPMPVGSVLTNTVKIGALRAATAIYTTTTQVNAQPILSMSVLDSSDPVQPGQSFVYNILYRNDGTAPATGVRITDTFPSQVTFVSSPLPPVITGTNFVVWSPGTLNVGGASSLIAATVRVNSPATDGIVMTNTVTIDTNETSSLTVTEPTQVKAPRLQLTKSANPVAPAANGLLTYTLQYTNSGSLDASNVVITDAVPLNTAFQSCTSGCSLNGNIVNWTLGPVPSQTSNALALTVQVSNSLPNGTILTNTARITSTELATAFVVLTSTVSSAPNVSLLKSDGVTLAAAGDVLMYQLAYTNTGNAPAQTVVITDRIPANVNSIGCVCTAVGGGVYSFTIGTVKAAQGGVVTLSVTVNSPLAAGVRSITNTAYIQTSTSGDNLADNSAQDVDTISTVPAVKLTVAYDANTPYPGKTITYTLRYTNTSLMDTTGVVISTTRSPYVSVIPTGWSLSGGDDIYTVNNLAAGQTGTITYVVVLTSTFTPAMNAFSNTFLIHDGGPGGLPVASQNVTTIIGVPDLFIESVRLPAAVRPGDLFTATLTIRNGGAGRACNPSLPVCGPTWVDAFVPSDPAFPPTSYPFSGYGSSFARTPQIDPGITATVYITNIKLTAGQNLILYFKVDNYACPGTTCVPLGSLGGLVPESNEYNNVVGPIAVYQYAVHLPLIKK